ncbi:MAG: hypothetical protein AAF585_08625 [Verrucomicrobiota bacterium]
MDATSAGFSGLGIVGVILAIVGGIGCLVCAIMVIIAAFKNEESPLMGILCIVCGLSFILGWVKNGPWGVKKIMLWYTICIVAAILGQILMGAGAAGAVQNMDLDITVPE